MKKTLMPWIMTSCLTIGISVYSYITVNEKESLNDKLRTEIIRTNILHNMNDSLNRTISVNEVKYQTKFDSLNSIKPIVKKAPFEFTGDVAIIHINGRNINTYPFYDYFYPTISVVKTVDSNNKLLLIHLKRK